MATPVVDAETVRRREFLTEAMQQDRTPDPRAFGFGGSMFKPGSVARDSEILDFDAAANLGVGRAGRTGTYFVFSVRHDTRKWMQGRGRYEASLERFEMDTVVDDNGVIWADVGSGIDRNWRVTVQPGKHMNPERDTGHGPDVMFVDPDVMEAARSNGCTDTHLGTAGMVAARTGHCRSSYVAARAAGDSHEEGCWALETFPPDQVDDYVAGRRNGRGSLELRSDFELAETKALIAEMDGAV